MTTVLSILLSVTRGALLTAALIVLVRLAFRRVLTAKAKYYLWLLLALRLMLPVVPESPVSLLNFLPERTSVQMQSAPAAPRGPGGPDAVLWEGDPETVPEGPEVPNALVAADLSGTPGVVEEFPAAPEAPAIPEAPTEPGIPGTTILLWVWIAGMGLVLAVYGTLYIITAMQLKHLPVCTDNDTLRVFLRLKRECGVRGRVRLVCGGAGMLGGLLRPTIVLPVEKHGEDVAPIIVHELMHHKYKDLWISALLRLLTAVYWFNPVVWVCFHFAKLDGEAACDQRVLETRLVRPERYAGALYEEGAFSMRKSVLMQTTFGGSRHSLKRRIRHIAKFKHPTVWVTALAVTLAVIVTACTMTEATPKAEIQAAIVGAEETSMLLHSGYYPTAQSTTADLTEDEIAAQVSAMDALLHHYYSEDSWVIGGASGDEGINPWIKDYEYWLREVWTEPETLCYLVDSGILSCKLSRLQISGDTATVKTELVSYSNVIEMDEDGKFVIRCGGDLQEDLTYHLIKVDNAWKVQKLDTPGGDAWMHAWSADIGDDSYDTFAEALEAAQAIDGRNQCPYQNLDTSIPHISPLPSGFYTGDSEVSSALENAADSLTFSPYVLDDDSLTYENTTWDMTVSQAISAQKLDMDTWKLSDFGQPTIYLEQPLPDHPEVEQITYIFHVKNPALILELSCVEIEYDPEQIDYESLIAQRTQELGTPEGSYENNTFWTFGDIQLAIYPGKHDLQERLMVYVDRSEELLPTQEQLTAYLSDIQPPNGHYGWTFEEHVEAGLLDPEQGELVENDGAIRFHVFETEMELGGEMVDMEYHFTETMASWGTGRQVLTEVHVDPPSDVPLSQWLTRFPTPWKDRMVRLPESSHWNGMLTVGPFLTDAQREYIAQALVEDGRSATSLEEAYQYLNNWNMAMNFYEAARGWVFNGTGAALYLTAQDIE